MKCFVYFHITRDLANFKTSRINGCTSSQAADRGGAFNSMDSDERHSVKFEDVVFRDNCVLSIAGFGDHVYSDAVGAHGSWLTFSSSSFLASKKCSAMTSDISFIVANNVTFVGENNRLECFPGTEMNKYTCRHCVAQKYSLNNGTMFPGSANKVPEDFDKENVYPCMPCPFGADCEDGGDDIKPKVGFWIFRKLRDMSTTSAQSRVFKCPSGYCTNDARDDDGCSGNRTGRLCGKCQPEFRQCYRSSTCMPYGSQTSNSFLSSFMRFERMESYVVLAFGFGGYMFLSPAETKDGVIKCTLYYIQMLPLVLIDQRSEISAGIAEFVRNLVLFLNLTPSSTMGSGTCFSPFSDFTSYGKLQFKLYVPFMLLGVVVMIWTFNLIATMTGRAILNERIRDGTVSDGHNEGYTPLPDDKETPRFYAHKSSFSKWFLFSYSSLVASIAPFMNCVSINRVSYLYVAAEEKCERWGFITFLYILLGIAPFGLLCYLLLFRRRDHGVFYTVVSSCFKEEYFYWEVILLYYRFMMQSLAVFMSNDSREYEVYRTALMSLLTSVMLCAQTNVSPFRSRNSNLLQTALLFFLLFFLISGSPWSTRSYNVDDHDTGFNDLLDNIRQVQQWFLSLQFIGVCMFGMYFLYKSRDCIRSLLQNAWDTVNSCSNFLLELCGKCHCPVICWQTGRPSQARSSTLEINE